MICYVFSVLNFHQLFPASFGWRTKRLRITGGRSLD
jgi:hypothetical protein